MRWTREQRVFEEIANGDSIEISISHVKRGATILVYLGLAGLPGSGLENCSIDVTDDLGASYAADVPPANPSGYGDAIALFSRWNSEAGVERVIVTFDRQVTGIVAVEEWSGGYADGPIIESAGCTYQVGNFWGTLAWQLSPGALTVGFAFETDDLSIVSIPDPPCGDMGRRASAAGVLFLENGTAGAAGPVIASAYTSDVAVFTCAIAVYREHPPLGDVGFDAEALLVQTGVRWKQAEMGTIATPKPQVDNLFEERGHEDRFFPHQNPTQPGRGQVDGAGRTDALRRKKPFGEA